MWARGRARGRAECWAKIHRPCLWAGLQPGLSIRLLCFPHFWIDASSRVCRAGLWLQHTAYVCFAFLCASLSWGINTLSFFQRWFANLILNSRYLDAVLLAVWGRLWVFWNLRHYLIAGSNGLSISPAIFSGPTLELKDLWRRASEFVFR